MRPWLKPGDIEKLDNGERVYDEDDNYFYKYAENDYRFFFGAYDEEGNFYTDEDPYFTRKDLEDLTIND